MRETFIKTLKQGGVGVIPTDTIYGVVGSAMNTAVVERIYLLRERTPGKPMIILISEITDLRLFGIGISEKLALFLGKIWPGKVGVVLSCPGEKFEYLHRGTQSLAFRVPDRKDLRSLLRKSGPLVAPSANPEGKTPASDIAQAKSYFGSQVDFYIEGGKIASPPSTLIKIEGDRVTVLRPGAVEIKDTSLS